MKIDVGRLRWSDDVVALDELAIDSAYQRHEVARLIARIGASFNPILAGKLVVSCRNGASYVVDGQQRVKGARLAGIDRLAATKIWGLDQETEARLFLELNEGRVAVRAIDKFKAAYRAGEPYALAIASVVEQYGGHIRGVHRTERNTDLVAVEALRWIHLKGGERGLAQTFAIITKAFGELTQATCPGQLAKGIFAVLAMHWEEVDPERLARNLGRAGVHKIVSEANAIAKALAGSANQRSFYLALLGVYNEGRRRATIEPVATLNKVGSSWREGYGGKP
jgi:hypothetical protein